MEILLFAAALCFGISIGCFLMNAYWFKRLYGVFKIDFTYPDKDICRLELNSMDLDALAKKNYIVLKVSADFPDEARK